MSHSLLAHVPAHSWRFLSQEFRCKQGRGCSQVLMCVQECVPEGACVSISTGDPRALERLNLMVSELAKVQEALGGGYL